MTVEKNQDPTIQRLDIIEFPCEFPVKVMGKRVDDFAQTIGEVVLNHAPDFDVATIEMRPSSSGKYLSLTCTINAVSQAQLDDLYRALSAHPLASYVL